MDVERKKKRMVPKKIDGGGERRFERSRNGGLTNGRERLNRQTLQNRNKARVRMSEAPITCRKKK